MVPNRRWRLLAALFDTLTSELLDLLVGLLVRVPTRFWVDRPAAVLGAADSAALRALLLCFFPVAPDLPRGAARDPGEEIILGISYLSADQIGSTTPSTGS